MTDNEKSCLEQLLDKQTAELARHVAAISESFDQKIDMIAEGYITLRQAIQDLAQKTDERFDQVDFKFEILNNKIDGVAADLKATDERLSKKIDGVAADLKATDERLGNKIDAVAFDLKAHRSDTEAHGGIYRVKES